MNENTVWTSDDYEHMESISISDGSNAVSFVVCKRCGVMLDSTIVEKWDRPECPVCHARIEVVNG